MEYIEYGAMDRGSRLFGPSFSRFYFFLGGFEEWA